MRLLDWVMNLGRKDAVAFFDSLISQANDFINRLDEAMTLLDERQDAIITERARRAADHLKFMEDSAADVEEIRRKRSRVAKLKNTIAETI